MESKEIIWAKSLLLEKSISLNSIDDFKSGVLLIELLQIITDKNILKYFKNPRNRIQSIENANIALTFMKQNSLLFTQVSPQDLIDGSEKSIISMIYRLYLLVTSKSKGNKKKYRLSLDDNKLEDLPKINSTDNNLIKNSISDDNIHSTIVTQPSGSLEDISSSEDEKDDNKNWKKTLNSNFSKLKDEKNFLGNNRRMTFSNSMNANLSDSTTNLLSLSNKSSNTSPITSSPLISSTSPSTPNSLNTNDTCSNSSISSSNSNENLLNSPTLSNSLMGSNTIELSSSLTTSSLNPWFSVKVDANKSKNKGKVPLLVKISAVDLQRYDNPEFLPKILKTQQAIKCWLAKRKLKQMIKYNNHRNRCFKEIISSEETFVQVVEKIVKVFYEQLLWNSKYSPQPYLTLDNISTIFSTISEIYSFNQELLKRLKERQLNWDHRQKVGDVFVSLGHFLKVYKTYCLNYDNAIVCLTAAKKNEKFVMFIKSILNHPDNVGTQSLESLLITVVQRIPRYIMLLQDLFKHTWSDHKDYSNLKTAIKMITDIANEVNSSIKMAESQSKVLEIQKSLIGFDAELVCPSRHFIKKGLILDCKLDTNRFTKDNDEMLYFLFNDSILLVTEQNNSQKSLQFKYFFDLTDHQTRIKDVDDNQVIKNGFQLISGPETLIFSCKSLQEKQELIQHIKNFQSKSRKLSTLLYNNSTHHLGGSLESSIGSSSSSIGSNTNLNNNNNSSSSLIDDESDLFFITGQHTVKIFKSENKKEPGKKEYTLYHISITKELTDEVVIVTKRYSDFDHLSKKLKKKFPDKDLKDLPKKHLINSLGSSTVESRRIMLEVFLQHCFQLENIRTSVYLINFIKSLKPQFNSESTVDEFTRSDSTRSDMSII